MYNRIIVVAYCSQLLGRTSQRIVPQQIVCWVTIYLENKEN